jgi:hypothetical protein
MEAPTGIFWTRMLADSSCANIGSSSFTETYGGSRKALGVQTNPAKRASRPVVISKQPLVLAACAIGLIRKKISPSVPSAKLPDHGPHGRRVVRESCVQVEAVRSRLPSCWPEESI